MVTEVQRPNGQHQKGVWRFQAEIWNRHFGELKTFKKQHGHCNVPYRFSSWVVRQRYQRKHGKLSEEQIRRLDQLGFIWNCTATWEERFAELKAFKRQHGHCKVPYRSTLGVWICRQRYQRKHGKLSEKRIRRLDPVSK